MILLAIIVVVYVLVGLTAARLTAGHLAWTFVANDRYYSRKQPDGDQWFGAWCCGILAGMAWPVILVFVLLPTHRGRWVVGAEARAVQKAREKKIAEAERELGIG